LYYLGQAVEKFGNGTPVRIETSAKPIFPAPSRIQRLTSPWRRLLGWLSTPSAPRHSSQTLWIRGRFEDAMVEWFARLNRLDRATCAALLNCDFLVVHENHIAERILHFYPRAAHKLGLITHAPTFFVDELATYLFPWLPEEQLYDDPVVTEFRRRELAVMQSVRAVLWPCPAAHEAYQGWDDLAQAGQVWNVYAETGCGRPTPGIEAAELRRRWGIPPDVCIALYLGRPHPHKGWLRFLEWANWYRRQSRDHWRFLFAGPPPDMAFHLSAVQCLGYVRDNGAALLAADLVVIPNRYTYFDLGVLEAMSLGARVAVSPTGGNKHLLQACPALGVIPEGPAETVWPALESVAADYANQPDKAAALVRAWETRFSLRPFVQNHVRAAEEILAGRAQTSRAKSS
jgi:glycosyltransferase involved in cell wall biosynthesis